MKRILFFTIFAFFALTISANTETEARKILDKTASIVGKKSGAQAKFTISSKKIGKTNGTIAIKGNKFNATTPQATVWFDGKTQWAYMKSTDEVNITTPTKAQQAQMNPLTFINMYKKGYKLSMKNDGENYEIRMQAEDKGNSVQEMYIVVNQTSHVPSQIRMRQKGSWITINISDFKAAAQYDGVFEFNKKDFPSAEIVDLR